jgi:hypothetical protein
MSYRCLPSGALCAGIVRYWMKRKEVKNITIETVKAAQFVKERCLNLAGFFFLHHHQYRILRFSYAI